MDQETLSVEDYGNWSIRHERWRMDEDDNWTAMDVVVNAAGQHIGSVSDAHTFRSRGIEPELSQDDHSTCSIGFCEREQKWYGWSHRAMYGFGVGHVAEEGNCEVASGWVDNIDPETGEEDLLPVPVGFTSETLEDCKRLAVAFAASVS